MFKIVVVIPTYNEADNLEAITKALFALDIQGLSILIVDDDSPDGTGEIAEQLALKHPEYFHVIHRKGKMGLGTAYLAGFQWALAQGASTVIQMDADFSHSPTYIPQMLPLLDEYDVVVGSRYVQGGKVDERWGFGRWLLSWWANSVWVRLILWTKTKDATAGFKCWQAKALQKLQLENIRSNGYIFQVEMCYVAEKTGLRIKEFPIYFEDRRIGKSKMSIPIKLEAALRVFQIRWRYHTK
jgi:dolichol-phosphate mannosyltransferase